MLKWSLFGAFMCVIAVQAIQHLLPAMLETKPPTAAERPTDSVVKEAAKQPKPVRKTVRQASSSQQKSSAQPQSATRVKRKPAPKPTVSLNKPAVKRTVIMEEGLEPVLVPISEPRPVEGSAKNRKLISVTNAKSGD